MYAVRFLNPHPVEGHSPDWPAELIDLGEAGALPEGDGWQEMTPEDYQIYLSNAERYLPDYLAGKKREQIIHAIDAKTREIISRGFVFEEKIFSLSLQAQQNIQNIQLTLMIGSIGDVPYPTLDDQVYILQRVKMPAFIEAAFGTLNAGFLGGVQLKGIVNAMTTLEQLEAFTDPRT